MFHWIMIIAIALLVAVLGVPAAWKRFTGSVSRDDTKSDPANRDNGSPEMAEPQTPGPQSASAAPVVPPPAPTTARAAAGEFAHRNHAVVGLDAAAEMAMWNEDTISGFQERWHKVQLRFVDDPHNAAAEAETLITDVIESLASTVNAQKTKLDAWRSSNGADTEELRIVVRRYHDFLDRVLRT
jgi:hypothetical protein